MRIIKTANYEEMSQKAADVIASQVILEPNSVLGLATGGTMEGVYKEVVTKYKNGDLDFSNVKSVNLDEYVGLDGTHNQSYRYYMDTNLFNHINIDKKNTNLPDGLAKDLDTECKKYDSIIESLGKINLQLLGLGSNGHVGFNEPADEFVKTTNHVNLKEETIKSNARFFDSIDEVPTQAITMGIKTIMQAKKILLCVNGSAKAEILKEVLFGPVTPKVPGSILQLHKNLIVVADEEALSLCK